MRNPQRLSLICLSVLSASVLLASTAASAGHSYKGENYKGEAMPAPCPIDRGLLGGFYLGGQVGYDNYQVRQSSDLTSFGVTVSRNPSVSANGFVGGVFGGYGQYFNNVWYLGGEAFINGSNASFSHSITATALGVTTRYSNNFNVNGSWGVSLLPGWRINNDALLYVRLGYNQANLKGSETFTVVGVGTATSSKSGWRGGFNYGLGAELLAWQNWSVRGEFTHTSYSSFTNTFGTKFTPSDNQLMLGVVYHFV